MSIRVLSVAILPRIRRALVQGGPISRRKLRSAKPPPGRDAMTPAVSTRWRVAIGTARSEPPALRTLFRKSIGAKTKEFQVALRIESSLARGNLHLLGRSVHA